MSTDFFLFPLNKIRRFKRPFFAFVHNLANLAPLDTNKIKILRSAVVAIQSVLIVALHKISDRKKAKNAGNDRSECKQTPPTASI
jgi:hypothetical protein